MRILHLVHGLPPDRVGGTETYTWQLARALAARGHEVEVLATTKDLGRADLSLRSSVREGVQVHSLAHNLLHADFRATWDDPRIVAAIAPLLSRRYDLVHVQHLIQLGMTLPAHFAQQGAAVVMTLHDYWSQCARHGQRLHPDGNLCATLDPQRCGACLVTFEHNQGRWERRLMPVVRMVKQASGLDLSASARRAKRWLGKRAPVATAATQADAARALAEQVVVRATELRQQLSAQVQLYFAPSRFVLERSVLDGGLPRERMVHLPFGIADGVLGVRSPRPAEAPLQIGYLGARIRAKGPDLLLRAWAQLPNELRQRGVLRVCGSDANEPTYQAELRQLALAAGARLEGVLDRAAVARLYAELDLLVVPSRWWENAPLVVQEARAAGVPLLVADHGGLAELVEPGIDGWRFRPGSVEDLSARLAQVLSRELDTRALHPRPVPAWSWHVDQVEAHYRAVVP